MQQLVFPIAPRQRLTRADFIAAPGNERALRFLETWPHWPAPAAALHGPSASGKSHLVQIWAALSGATVIAAADLREPIAGAVAVEDVDAVAHDGHERALFALFERGTPLLLTGRTPPADWRVALPDLASRYRATLGFDLGAPDDALLAGLAAKLFADRQLAVPEGVIRVMIERLARSPEAIRDFVAAADARALSEKRPINQSLIREMLATPL
jgi:chromosomal replication initiation ATPase DnaA